jgi:integrase
VLDAGRGARLALELSAFVGRYGGGTVVTDELGRPTSPWAIERAIRASRKRVDGLPPGFRFHDLRHYLASVLVASEADVKVVQKRMPHASAMTTLNTYGHMWPDADESTRAAVAGALAARRARDSHELRTDCELSVVSRQESAGQTASDPQMSK